MDGQKTTATKAWIGGLVSWGFGMLLPILERWLMTDLPSDVENAIMAAITGAVVGGLVWFFPNKPIEDKPNENEG